LLEDGVRGEDADSPVDVDCDNLAETDEEVVVEMDVDVGVAVEDLVEEDILMEPDEASGPVENDTDEDNLLVAVDETTILDVDVDVNDLATVVNILQTTKPFESLAAIIPVPSSAYILPIYVEHPW
jgi:hypothetical protein